MKKVLTTSAFAALLGAATLAMTAGVASAAVVCNNDGDCWHTKDHYAYPPSVGITIHGDDWKWGGNEKYRFHEHEGRGYWKSGVWITF